MQNEIRGINIKKLLWKVIFGWKYILISGIVFAVLFAGYKYMADSDANSNEVTITGQVSGSELQKVNELMAYYDRLNFYEDYYNNSLMFKVNPEKYQYLVLQYYVDSEYSFNLEQSNETDYTSALVSAYHGYFSNNLFAVDLKAELGTETEAKYLKELIQSTAHIESFTIQMTVGIPEGYDASAIEKAIDKIITDKSREFAGIGEHKLEKINSSLNVTYSTSVEQLIYNTRTTIDGLRKNINSLKSGLSDNQKMFMYNNLKYDAYKTEFKLVSSANNNTEPSINITYAVIGFVLGAFIVCAYYLMREILSGKMQNEDDLEAVYGVKKFGCIEIKDKEAKRFIVDRILYNIKNRNNNILSKEKQIEYIATGVKLACTKLETKSLCLVQSKKLNVDDELITKLIKKLKSEGLICDIVSDIDSDCDSLKRATASENVILLEKLGDSLYANIDNQIKVLVQYNVNVLGSIILV